MGCMREWDYALVILFEINPISISFDEFECHAPRSIDVDRITGWIETPQSVEIESGNVQFSQSFRAIQPV